MTSYHRLILTLSSIYSFYCFFRVLGGYDVDPFMLLFSFFFSLANFVFCLILGGAPRD